MAFKLLKEALMSRSMKGFTLIELMIVIAISGILTVISVSAYRSYVAKAQFSEAISLIGGYKSQVVEYLQTNGVCPSNRSKSSAAAGSTEKLVDSFPKPTEINGKYVEAVIIAQSSDSKTCGIWAQFRSQNISSALSGKFVVYRMIGTAGSMSTTPGAFQWECLSQVGSSNVPNSCAGDKNVSAAY